MSEALPQITYEPEGMLKVQSVVHPAGIPDLEKKLRPSMAHPGIEFERVDDLVVSNIDVVKALSHGLRRRKRENRNLAHILGVVDGLAAAHDDDSVDTVIGLRGINDRGPKVTVHNTFLSWLHSAKLTEDAAKRGIAAMKLPFQEKRSHGQDDDLQVSRGSGEAGFESDGFLIRVCSQQEFALSRNRRRNPDKAHGTAFWKAVRLVTHSAASCEIMEDNKRVYLYAPSTRLYEMTTSVNHDKTQSMRESLSIVLGLGSLAREAAGHAPEAGNVLDQIRWHRSVAPMSVLQQA